MTFPGLYTRLSSAACFPEEAAAESAETNTLSNEVENPKVTQKQHEPNAVLTSLPYKVACEVAMMPIACSDDMALPDARLIISAPVGFVMHDQLAARRA
jgi:hypothetical protein